MIIELIDAVKEAKNLSAVHLDGNPGISKSLITTV